ncbi:MAG: MoaD/ThiS family protein [Pseudomonadota bacterium]
MRIRARLGAMIGDRVVSAEGSVEMKDGALLRDFFKNADLQLGFKKEKPFRKAARLAPPPTVLLNGDRLDFPAGLKTILREGDEITVLTPMMGG